MNNIKIIFFDIDGTLIEQKKLIKPRILQTLRDLKKNNIKICIATSRSPMQLPKLDVKFDAYLTFNGSYSYNDHEVIYSNPLNKQDILTIIENAKKIHKPLVVATKDRLAPNGSDADLREYLAFGRTKLVVAPDFDQVVKNETIYQILMSCRKNNYADVLNNVKGAKITAWWDRAVDIIPTNGGKGLSVEKVMQYYHFNKDQAMAFGDGSNDIPMLESVGHGIAMGNATDDVKAAADDVCDTVQNDGVYTYCKKNNLI